MIAFQPKGDVESFTGATTAPTSVQAVGNDGAQQYCLSNTSSTIDCIVGWGQTDVEAKANATAGNANSYYLMHSTQVVVTAPINAYFSGVTSSSTAVVKVQAGIGN